MLNRRELIIKAVDKACAGGYKIQSDWQLEIGRILDGTNYYSIIFDREFLSGLWGSEEHFLPFNSSHPQLGDKCILWQWHAKQMVLSKNPLEYLEENIERDNWNKILQN